MKTRHLLQLVEWVKNALDLQVGDHHHHLEEKLRFKINACRSHQAVVVQVITAMICELMPFAEGFDHHHQVARSVVETGAKSERLAKWLCTGSGEKSTRTHAATNRTGT